MELRFVEATNGPNNWGKFAVGRHGLDEWLYPSQLPAAGGRLLLVGRGRGPEHVWVLDLETGEGAMFRPGGLAAADLDKHRIWVCPLFEPFLAWFYGHVKDHPENWWETLPDVVDLPDEPFEMRGYRRPGPKEGWYQG